ncbi:DUF3995 domain-containing protein [Cytophagales bacterium LB-30]|uniref:DUF3995 domain-containing protein n=1 Tax=Shiella aurantiaca TaxID=3058365 RepID=A0ABT8F6Y9_9BACT|nr:DUF3995 domain-containing protein [Shiella aurantiaca]MDN4166004.1 DUF3995 domain-containing protein [Shiella aurantiaca]
MMVLSLLLSGVFFLLALLHFYWALGGRWAFDNTLPTNEAGKKMLSPGTLSCLVVALGLSAFGLLYVWKAGVVAWGLPEVFLSFGLWICPVIFGMRALGDFRYVGFFKSVSSTPFAKRDTYLYSPLCLFIAITGFLLAFFF